MPEFAGRIRDDAGSAIQGAVVNVYDEGTSTPSRGTDTTDVNGEWDISVATRGPYDVEIVNGTDVIWWNARDQYQGQTLQLWQPTANEEAFTITRAEDAASVEVGTFEGDRATMADNDEAYVSFKMSDDAGTQTEIARQTWVITDVTDTTEDGRIDWAVMTAGTLADELQLDGAALSPSTNDGIALGTTSLGYSDLHLATGGVINWANGEVTLTETDANTLTLAGGSLALGTGTLTAAAVLANADDSGALGASGTAFSDLFLASGAVVNFNAGDVTLTHAANKLTLAGGKLQFTPEGDATIPTDGQYIWSDVNGDLHLTSQGALLVDLDTNNNNTDKTFAVRTNAGTTALFAVNEAGLALIGDTANANMTVGLTINQGANDDHIITLKSSDIATGLTSLLGHETDDYGSFQKASATLGGVRIDALGEDGALNTVLTHVVAGGTADTTKTTAGVGLVNYEIREHDGANAQADITADGNVWSVRARVGGSMVTRVMADEDGDFYSVTAAQTFDDFDDLALVDTYDSIRGGFGEWAKEHEEQLVKLKILGAPVAEGGMTNVTQLQRLHNGAIRQITQELRDTQARLALAESKLAALPQGA